MKKLTIFILFVFLSHTIFSYITMVKFDDHYFPQISLEFVSDFSIEENKLYVIENGANSLPFTFTSRCYKLSKPLEIVIFIDESTAFKENFDETRNELIELYRMVRKNGYDVKLSIITSSENKNKAYFSGKNNLFSYDETVFEDLLNKIFNHQRKSVSDFNLILKGFSEYSYDEQQQLVFIIITSGKEIDSIVDKLYLTDRIIFKKSEPDIFIFSENDSFYSKFYYEKLVSDVGGAVLVPEENSIADVLNYYYGEQLYKNIITYVSDEQITPQEYFIKLFFNDTKEEYVLKMASDFYDDIRINSITAVPFLVKSGEIITLKCLTTPSDDVIYQWKCDSGNFNNYLPTNNEIQWEAPLKEGMYIIRVHCTYKGSDIESEKVVLVKN